MDAELAEGGDVELGSGSSLQRPAAGSSGAPHLAIPRTGATPVAVTDMVTNTAALAERSLRRVSGRLDSTGHAVVDGA